MMDRLMRKNVILAGFATIASLLLVACQNPESSTFQPEDELRSVDMVANAQAAAGARADAMLYPMHFDGAALNSLGKQKLEMMIAAGNKATLVVYLDLPKGDAMASDRTKAVGDFLGGKGMQASAFKVEMGPNPASHNMSQPGIARLSKTENPGMSSEGGGEGGSTMAAGSDTAK